MSSRQPARTRARSCSPALAALTASERRVAQMAAKDLSNKEIAQALFVTVKTVEQHLGRVYRKLDIGSRKQLGAALVAPAEGSAETPAGAMLANSPTQSDAG